MPRTDRSLLDDEKERLPRGMTAVPEEFWDVDPSQTPANAPQRITELPSDKINVSQHMRDHLLGSLLDLEILELGYIEGRVGEPGILTLKAAVIGLKESD